MTVEQKEVRTGPLPMRKKAKQPLRTRDLSLQMQKVQYKKKLDKQIRALSKACKTASPNVKRKMQRQLQYLRIKRKMLTKRAPLLTKPEKTKLVIRQIKQLLKDGQTASPATKLVLSKRINEIVNKLRSGRQTKMQIALQVVLKQAKQFAAECAKLVQLPPALRQKAARLPFIVPATKFKRKERSLPLISIKKQAQRKVKPVLHAQATKRPKVDTVKSITRANVDNKLKAVKKDQDKKRCTKLQTALDLAVRRVAALVTRFRMECGKLGQELPSAVLQRGKLLRKAITRAQKQLVKFKQTKQVRKLRHLNKKRMQLSLTIQKLIRKLQKVPLAEQRQIQEALRRAKRQGVVLKRRIAQLQQLKAKVHHPARAREALEAATRIYKLVQKSRLIKTQLRHLKKMIAEVKKTKKTANPQQRVLLRKVATKLGKKAKILKAELRSVKYRTKRVYRQYSTKSERAALKEQKVRRRLKKALSILKKMHLSPSSKVPKH